MKKLLTLLLLSPLAFAEQIETKFSLSCKITDQVLLQSIDGVPKRHSHSENLQNGDITNLDFIFIEYPSNGSYVLHIFNEDIKLRNTLTSLRARSISNGLAFEWIGKENILQEDWFHLRWISNEIDARRYYKNDWHFRLTNTSDVTKIGLIMTANCMQMPKEWDDILQKIQLLDKDRWGLQN